jgi:transcriptional regulator with XRE-family HTH domain
MADRKGTRRRFGALQSKVGWRIEMPHGRGRSMPKKMHAAEIDAVDLPPGKSDYFGVKLKHTRLTKGLRLRDLAEKAECSESMLSKIENGRAVPSLKTLYRLAKALDLTVGQLFAQPVELNGLVSRDGERPIVQADPLRNGPGLTMERLIPYHQSHLLQGSIHNIAPGGSGGGLVAHEGEEVAYIIEGEVEYIVGEERFLLKAGDSICYRSEQPHGYRNDGKGSAKLIVVNTPPSF